MEEETEHAALIQRILGSPPFVKARLRQDLLKYLFAHRFKVGPGKRKEEYFCSAKRIAKDVFNMSDDDSGSYEAGRVRERCLDLRKALQEFDQASNAAWRCELPDAIRGEGYRLQFLWREVSAPQLFWRPHLEANANVIVITNSLLFFYDYARHSVFRFFDTNIAEGSSEEALAALQRKHPESFRPDLTPVHFYLSSGEMAAFETLHQWFESAGKRIVRRDSREMVPKEILESSPILLGTRHTSKFVRRILDSPQAQHLAYRFHEHLGAVQITDIRDEEKPALSRFPLTDDGVVGPVPNWTTVFGIATRLPNPGGHGHVTIISSDFSALGMARIAATLTNNDRCARLLSQMKWPAQEPLPPSFELLFALRLAPGNIEGEIGLPELLAWRPHPDAA